MKPLMEALKPIKTHSSPDMYVTVAKWPAALLDNEHIIAASEESIHVFPNCICIYSLGPCYFIEAEWCIYALVI